MASSELPLRHSAVSDVSNISRNTSSNVIKWTIGNSKFPQAEVIYFTQVFLIYSVAFTCIINLSLNTGNPYTWSNLLSACVGYMLPAPQISSKSNHQHQTRQPTIVEEVLSTRE